MSSYGWGPERNFREGESVFHRGFVGVGRASVDSDNDLGLSCGCGSVRGVFEVFRG